MISSFIDIQLLFTWHKLMRFHRKKTNIHPYYTIELRTGVHLGTIHYFRNEKCVRNVSYNCFWDNHWGRTGQLLWRMDIPLNNQPKHARSWLLISQLFQGTSSKHTNNVQFHIQDWRRENLMIGRLTKTLSFNHFKSLYLSLLIVQYSLFMN